MKGNQPTLHQGLMDHFAAQDGSALLEDNFAQRKVRRHQTNKAGHVRKDERTYFICPVPDDLPDRKRWTGMKAIGLAVTSTMRGG
jgi:hypothetical protein